MAATAFVRARVNEEMRDEAAAVLAEMGLTVSDVIRITLTRVAKERALPFELKIPNAVTREAMDEARATVKSRRKGVASAEELFDALDKEAGK
ncbi:MAG TPA: type II toxin-antitoxin system RelB/DinJ family antitoxin [Devosia sp.]